MKKIILSIALITLLSLSLLAGCGSMKESAKVPVIVEETAESAIIEETADTAILTGGVLCLKVNPEIAIHYDDKGLVTKIEARNNDAKAIIEKYTGYEGKETHAVVKDLVAAIGNAGYFVEEVEGVGKRITIEIEVGSVLPNDTFVDKVVAEVKDYVSSNNYRNSIELEGNTDYGITDYGVAPKTTTTAAPAPEPTPAPKAVTDYHITDYGVTNYDDTDYGPNNDGVTDYGKTNYDDHVTDYGKTNYDDHATDYGRTNYDNDSGYDD